ncbi:MAG: polysaccharide pyruvyl transferase family protein [Anaerolineae bacterium]
MNILIINLHSARNLGDDAIMYATLEGLKETFPSARIILAANDPRSWERYRCRDASVEVVGSLTTWVAYLKRGYWHARWSAVLIDVPLLILAALFYRLLRIRFLWGSQEKRRLLSAYYDADLVISCGGGNFYAHFWISLFFLVSLAALGLAIIMDRKVVMLPQSIGPIKGWLQRQLTRTLLNRVNKIMVREPRSLEFIQNALCLRKQAVLVPDLAFTFTPTEHSSVRLQDLQSGLKIGVTIIDRAAQVKGKVFTAAQQEIYEEALVAALGEISRKYGATIYLFPQCTGPDFAHDDRQALHRVFLRLYEQGTPVVLFDEFSNFLELKAVYALMDCIVGSRMHTAIFAISLGIPVILISYQPKSIGMMEYVGLGRFCYEIGFLDQDRLVSGLSELIENRDKIKKMIRERYSEIQERLQRWRYEVV